MFKFNQPKEGLGVYIVKKDSILFDGEESELKNAVKSLDLNESEYIVFSSYESRNYIFVKNEGIRKLKGNIEDARDFMYSTVLLELEDFDPKTESLIFNLTH